MECNISGLWCFCFCCVAMDGRFLLSFLWTMHSCVHSHYIHEENWFICHKWTKYRIDTFCCSIHTKGILFSWHRWSVMVSFVGNCTLVYQLFSVGSYAFSWMVLVLSWNIHWRSIVKEWIAYMLSFHILSIVSWFMPLSRLLQIVHLYASLLVWEVMLSRSGAGTSIGKAFSMNGLLICSHFIYSQSCCL